MRDDDSWHLKPTKADLEARLHALQAKRDALLQELAAPRIVTPSGEASTASILRVVDQTLVAAQPTLAAMIGTRDMLLADRDRAALESDTISAGALSTALNELSAQVVDFQATIARLTALVDTMRAAIETDRINGAIPPEAG